MSDPPFAVKGIDHIVLRVRALPRALGFYRDVLGCSVERQQAELGLTQLRAGHSLIDLVALDGVHHLDPDLATGWLTPPGFDQHAALDTAGGRGHRALHPHHEAVTASLVDRAHEVGLAVNTWTVDDPGRIRELAAMGVDGIITNVPDVALAALEPPSPWVRERRA